MGAEQLRSGSLRVETFKFDRAAECAQPSRFVLERRGPKYEEGEFWPE